MPNENTNKTAVTLEQLLNAHRRSNAKIAAVAKQVAGLGTAGISKIENSMYQPATCTTYTKTVDTEITMATATVGTLLDDEALAALTPAGADGEGNSQYAFLVNGVQTGTYTKNTKLSDILAGISGSETAGVTASYSAETGKFVFTAKNYGAAYGIEMGEGLADALFGPPAGSDKSGESFVAIYDPLLLAVDEDISFEFKADMDFYEIEIYTTKNGTIQEVVDKFNNSAFGDAHFYFNKYTGMIEARYNNSGAPINMKILDNTGEVLCPIKTPDFYTRGRDAVFTSIKVNGNPVEIFGKEVNITVPTRTSRLENDSKFQTEAQVAAAVAGAAHLKRKKVDSVDAIDPSAADADQYIYMVAKAGAKSGDKYDEYMVLDGEVEKVGDWAVDLSGFQAAEEGKGLSTNDFSDEAKAKLDSLTFATDAEVSAALDAIYGTTDEA